MGRHRTSHRRGESLLTAWHRGGGEPEGVRHDFMAWESGAAEPLLALEFQPPRAGPCACGFGLAAPEEGFSATAQGASPWVGVCWGAPVLWGPGPEGRTSVASLAQSLA